MFWGGVIFYRLSLSAFINGRIHSSEMESVGTRCVCLVATDTKACDSNVADGYVQVIRFFSGVIS